MKNFDLSVVIVPYKSQNTILDCLDSVYKTCKNNSLEVVLSDNSPDDETQKIVEKNKSKYPNLTYIHNHENLGFAAANNKGIKKTSGDYVLFLNPDMKLYEKTLDGMLEFMRNNPDAGASTCDVVLINGQHDDSSHRGFPTPWRSLTHFAGLSKVFPKSKLFAGYSMTYADLSKTHTIDALAGSFMLVPRQIGEKLSWWDDDYFFYGEDIDFCFRIIELGYKIYFVPEYKALHYKGVSSGIKDVSKEITTANRETKIKVTGWRFNAMKIFYDKHYRKEYPGFVRSLIFAAIDTKKQLALRKIK
jgi:GT2 family glycosyltransferase